MSNVSHIIYAVPLFYHITIGHAIQKNCWIFSASAQREAFQPQFSRIERKCRKAVKREDLLVKMIVRTCISPYPTHVTHKCVESFGKSDTLCKNFLTFRAFDGILILARKEVPMHVHDRVR